MVAYPFGKVESSKTSENQVLVHQATACLPLQQYLFPPSKRRDARGWFNSRVFVNSVVVPFFGYDAYLILDLMLCLSTYVDTIEGSRAILLDL